MNSNLEISYLKGSIPSFVMDILTLGVCRLFFTVHFLTKDDVHVANYKIAGYKSLAMHKEVAIGDLLNTFISMLYDIDEAEKYLISCEDYTINENTIYVDSGFTRARLVYIVDDTKTQGCQKLIDFLNSMIGKTSECGKGYLDQIVKYMGEYNFNYENLIGKVEAMRQEIYLCGIE